MSFYGESHPDPDFTAHDEGMPNPLLPELLDRAALARIPKPAPLIPGVFNLNSLCWVAGAPGSYKTFVALDYALRVSREHPVLFVAGEGLSGLHDRISAWEHAEGETVDNFHVFPRAIPVTSAQWLLLCDVARTIGAKMVVLDTQARMAGGLDENSVPDMGRYIEGIDTLRELTGACVLSIHHSAKNGSHLRGSSAVQGAADSVVTVEVRNGIIGLHNLKQKDMAQFADRWYRPVNTLDSCVLVEVEKPTDWDQNNSRAYSRKKIDD